MRDQYRKLFQILRDVLGKAWVSGSDFKSCCYLIFLY